MGIRRLLILSCAIVFLDIALFAAITPLLPGYEADLGLTDTGVGVLSASYAAGTLIFSLPAGVLAARIGPRRAVVAGMVLMGLSSLAFGLSSSIVALDLSRLSQGAAGALMWSGAFTWLIAEAPVDRRGEAIGTAMAAAVFGQLLGAPIGALASHVGTELVFGSVALLALSLGAFAYTLPDAKQVRRQDPAVALSIARRPPIPRVALLIAFPSLVFGAVLVMVPLRMDELGAGAGVIAAAFASAAIIEGGLAPFVGRFSDRVGRVRPYLVGLTICAGTVFVIGLGSQVWLLFAAVTVVACGAGFLFTPATAMLSEAASYTGLHQGYTAAISNLAWGAGQAAGSFGAGAVAHQFGVLGPSIAVGLVALVAVNLIRRGATEFPRADQAQPAIAGSAPCPDPAEAQARRSIP